MRSVTDHDAALDALVDMLTDAGMVEEYTDDDGKPALRLTARGAQVGRALAMAGEDAEPETMLAALLDAQGPSYFPFFLAILNPLLAVAMTVPGSVVMQ